MTNEQDQLPFDAVAPNLEPVVEAEPVVEVAERIRPDGIPEAAWVAIQSVYNRPPQPRLFPNNPVKTREQLLREQDELDIRAMTRVK